jgi:molecular chaperone GrpE
LTEQKDLRLEPDEQSGQQQEDGTTVEGGDEPSRNDLSEAEGGERPPSSDDSAEEASVENPLELEIRQLRQQLEAAREEAESNYQRFLRTQADFDNFRRRTRQEKEEMAKYAAAGLIESLLPVIDNFERAIEAGKATDPASSLLQGIEMVYKQLKDALASAGLEEIDCLGKPFDPFQHEAVMREPSEEHEEGTVIDVLQKGYRLKERVIRPAMVKVSG